jgi:molecular chaperone GrpE
MSEERIEPSGPAWGAANDAANEAANEVGGDMQSGAQGGEPTAEAVLLRDEVGRLKDQLLRALAETENVRRRLEQQADERGRYAVSSFAKDMLSVADNLRRALDSIPADKLAEDELAKKLAEGVELTERGLITALERFGIKRVVAMGQKFDPHIHQAMMEVETDQTPPGTVVHEMQAGYTIHDRLLRPALVSVAKSGPVGGMQPGAAGVDTKA